MTIPSNTVVYCDANFLVAYGAKQVKQPEIQKRAQILFAQFLSKGCQIAASSLSFDEAWNGIRIEAGPKKIKGKARFLLNSILNKLGLRLINSGSIEFSYSDVLSDIKNFTRNLLDSPKFMVIQFPATQEKTGVTQSLDNIESFKLKPRDSFHLSIIQLNRIQHVVTRDSNDFGSRIKGSGINVISF